MAARAWGEAEHLAAGADEPPVHLNGQRRIHSGVADEHRRHGNLLGHEDAGSGETQPSPVSQMKSMDRADCG